MLVEQRQSLRPGTADCLSDDLDMARFAEREPVA